MVAKSLAGKISLSGSEKRPLYGMRVYINPDVGLSILNVILLILNVYVIFFCIILAEDSTIS